jgi:hypothetical protein
MSERERGGCREEGVRAIVLARLYQGQMSTTFSTITPLIQQQQFYVLAASGMLPVGWQ